MSSVPLLSSESVPENLQPAEGNVELTVTDEKTCSICLQILGEEQEKLGHKTGDVKHLFHENCLVPWLQIKPNCPICRINLPELAAQERAAAAQQVRIPVRRIERNDEVSWLAQRDNERYEDSQRRKLCGVACIMGVVLAIFVVVCALPNVRL